MKTYTAFCRDISDTGTTWIDTVEANNAEDAKQTAVERCAADWDRSEDQESIVCIGLAESNVKIIYWEDIEAL